MKEKRTTIVDMGYELKKKWRAIVIATLVITILISIINLFFLKPKYETVTKIFIGNDIESSEEKNNNDELQISEKLMNTYVELIKTEDLVEVALQKVGTDKSVENILENIEAEISKDTQIIQIKYMSTDAEEAFSIVKAITEEAIIKIKALNPSANVQVVREARIPVTPVSPNKIKNILIGFIISLVISVCIILILSYMDNTFKTRDQLEKSIDIPILALIPRSNERKKGKVELQENPTSIVSEAYRSLRTNIQYSSFDKKIKTIVLTSAEPSEGKSTTAANLALAMAQDEKKVIILDCDLRKPSLHKVFGISNDNGLSDVLLEKIDLRSAIQKQESGVHALTVGTFTPNPAEVIGSQVMESLIYQLKAIYDYIIIDTPPVLPVTDSQILASKVDGAILVVRAEVTKKDNLINAKKSLEKVNANIIGAVMNDVTDERERYSYYAYGEQK